MVAVYHDTKTLENISRSSIAILQLLAEEHISLVNVLGKKSGRSYDKESYLRRKDLLTNWNGYTVLAGCAMIIELKKIRRMEAGDHTIFLFDVGRFVTKHNNILTMDHLREKKLVSI